MSGNHSRSKGHAFERLIARKLRAKWPKARRGLQYQHGEHCPDVVGTPFYIECKRHKKIRPLQIKQWMAHAIRKRDLWGGSGITGISDVDRYVVLVIKEDRGTIDIVMEWPPMLYSNELVDCIYNLGPK